MKKSTWFPRLVIPVLLSLAGFFRAEESLAAAVAFESDAAAYALNGYSAILRVTHDNGICYALGTGRYRLPGFLVQSQSTDDVAGWQANSESIQVVRAGYRFCGARKNGPAVDAILLNQLWRLKATRLGEETSFKTLGLGISGGYYFHLGRSFYLYPIASVTWDDVYAGRSVAGDQAYEVPKLGLSGSVHVGWEL